MLGNKCFKTFRKKFNLHLIPLSNVKLVLSYRHQHFKFVLPVLVEYNI